MEENKTEESVLLARFENKASFVKSSVERIKGILENEAVLLHVQLLEVADVYAACDMQADKNPEFSPVRSQLATALASLQDTESILDDLNRNMYEAVKRANIAILQARRLNAPPIKFDTVKEEE